jgi:hypothetical protein
MLVVAVETFFAGVNALFVVWSLAAPWEQE